MKVKFSIIVPVYNGEKFIKQCIDSIINQKVKCYEIIVIDGGSSDNTVKILKSYKKKIRWISKKDKGQADAINKGISLSKGDWIGWQNCDDYYISKNVIKYFQDAIKKNKKKKLFVANINLVDVNNKILRDIKYFNPSFLSLLYEGMTLTNQACFWSKDLNKKIGILKNYKLNFDYEWFLRILKNFPECGYHINKTLACFRIYKGQKSQKQNLKDLKILYQIKKNYGFNKHLFFIIKFYLLILKLFLHVRNKNFKYVLRGVFKFFFGIKNKEYINN